MYRLLYSAHEEQFRHCLQLFLSDSAWQREHESIQGRAYGKESSHPPANGVQCILPMSALGSICDFVLSSMLDRALEAHYRVPGSVIFGGRKGTQVADVAWASQLVIEKGCDSRSKSCIGSADIEKFYDSLPMLQIGLYLLKLGFSKALIATCMFFQMFPCVNLSLLGHSVQVLSRSRGGLTGSRVAGCFGKVIGLDLGCSCAERWAPFSFNLGNRVLSAAIWIDNVFSFAPDPVSAVSILDIAERHLNARWGLKIKPSSRGLMACKGIDCSDVDPKWNPADFLIVLGHRILNDASIRREWNLVKNKLWAIFWANPGLSKMAGSTWDLKCSLLNRTVLAGVSWLFCRWPFQKGVAAELDYLQSRMLGMLARVPVLPSDDVVSFSKKRQHAGRKTASIVGLWSDCWRQRVLEWDRHVANSQQYDHINSHLLSWHGVGWLQQMRSAWVSRSGQGRNSLIAGRLGTRLFGGQPQPRWAEGIALANSREVIGNSNVFGSSSSSLNSRIREAQSFLNSFLYPGSPDNSG